MSHEELSELDKFLGRGPGGQILDGPPETVPEAPKKKRPPKWYGMKGEQWQRERLSRVFSATFRKNTDAPLDLKDQEGFVYKTVYPVNSVDFTGTDVELTLPGQSTWPYTVQVEVKTFQGNFTWTEISKAQARILDLARLCGELSLIGLCEREGETIIQGWLIPWRRPAVSFYRVNTAEARQLQKVAARTKRHISHLAKVKDWADELAWVQERIYAPSPLFDELNVTTWSDIIDDLQDRIGGNFKGKSLRTRDHDLLEPHAYTLTGRGYAGPPWAQSIATKLVTAEMQDSCPF